MGCVVALVEARGFVPFISRRVGGVLVGEVSVVCRVSLLPCASATRCFFSSPPSRPAGLLW